jgi:DNA-binding beta-propeller fold protein YncE
MGLLAPGAVVAGCRIESVVGRGGMGVVYRARELELDRVVALKLIAPELLEDAGIRERFLKEVRTAAAIEHPNVIPVYAAGERGGAMYLVMRYIDGADLRTLIQRDGPLAPGHAAEVVGRIAAGLDVIHRAGYVHRDVKPANVLVDDDGHVYVTDFGLAKQVLSRGATATGQWVGTLDYIAPEQVRGGRVDARADVYALGGVLCFLLTGHVPFERDRDEAKLWAQLSAPPPKPSELRPGLSRAFDDVVARAMAKEPADRYQSAGDLGRAAAAVAAGGTPQLRERMVARGAAAPGGAATELDGDGSTITAPRPAPATPPRRRRRWLLPLVALTALAVAAAIVAFRPQDEPAPAGIRVAETIRGVGERPNGIAVAGGQLWVTGAARTTVTRVDIATSRVLEDSPTVGLGALSIVASGSRVWVAARRARQVVELDAGTGRVVRRLRPGRPPTRLATGLGSLWVATAVDGARPAELVRYDDGGTELDRLPMPRGVAALTTGGGFVWVAERKGSAIVRIDPRTGEREDWAKLVGTAAALLYTADHVWATVTSADFLVRLDPRRPGNPETSAAEHRPAQMVAAGGRLFVAGYTDHSVLVFDPRSAKPVGDPLSVPNNPYAMAAGDGSVWVTGGQGSVTRIVYR